VSRFSIGLNPVMKAQDDKAYQPNTAAGMVYVSTGNNALYGGQNQTPGSWSFAIVNATVEVDGKVIVRNGQLVSAPVAKAVPMSKKSSR
jgi:aminopeptidase